MTGEPISNVRFWPEAVTERNTGEHPLAYFLAAA